MRSGFRLVRYFSLTSLAAIAIVAVSLAAYDAHQSSESLLQQGELRNAAQLQLILNELSDAERATLDGLVGRTVAPARDDPLVQRLHARFRATVAGTSIVKLKLYNPQGVTVYSSEPAQIGEDKSAYAGFVTARGGTPASQLSHRETFEAFGGRLREIDVIGSYLPVRGRGGRVDGVIEIYDDVTRLTATIERERWHVMLLSAALMTVLYLALLVIVSRAARALRAQHAALQREIRERTEIAAEAHRAQRATERAQRETEAAYALAMEARRTAVAADKAREALVASLRDGMRAPLNGIVGLADVLRGETSNAVQRDHVGRLRDCAVSLLAQLEDHAGVAAGPVVAAPFLPEAVVQDVVALYTPAARATGARLGCAVEPGTPGCVEGDGLGLRHLLRDLVGAALGHVPDGSVVVRVERVPGGTASIGRPGEPPDAPDAAEPGDALCWSVRVESPALFEGLSRFAADADAPARSWRGTFFDTRAVDRSAAALGATLSLKSDGHRFITVRLLTRHRPAAPAVVTADVTRVPAGAPHAMPAPRHAAAWPTTRRYEPEPAAALLPLPTDELEVDDDLPWAGQPTPA